MEWLKNTYLAVTGLNTNMQSLMSDSGRIDYIEQGSNGELKYRFKATGKRVAIMIELTSEMQVITKLDNFIIDISNSNKIAIKTDLISSRSAHIISLHFDTSYTDNVIISLYAEGIKCANMRYIYRGVDYVDNYVYLEGEDNAMYMLDPNASNPEIQVCSFDMRSTVSYNSGIEHIVRADINDNTLSIDDNGIVSTISTNATSVTLSKAQISSNYYRLYYTDTDNAMWRITYGTSGASIAERVTEESVMLVIGVGQLGVLYKLSSGVWKCIYESESGGIEVVTTTTISRKFTPTIAIESGEMKIYSKDKDKYYKSDEVTPFIYADVLAYVGNKAIIVWQDRIRIIDKEEIND